jgi:hypothetical protein
LEVSFEDRLQDEFQCTLDYAIANGRNRELANLAPLLRNSDLPRSLGSIAPLHQLLAKLAKKGVYALYGDGLERYPINTRGAIVLFGQFIGGAKCFLFADVAIQAPKSPRWFGLRLDVESSSQVLQRDGCLCHLTPAFPC